jgi:protease-4
VAAVVVRINSPGGSALGSDTLHHALTGLREAGKKLVVSCGDVTASGGVFMAVAADHILAQPGSITGSIGVITGKVDASEALKELGELNCGLDEKGVGGLEATSHLTNCEPQCVVLCFV